MDLHYVLSMFFSATLYILAINRNAVVYCTVKYRNNMPLL